MLDSYELTNFLSCNVTKIIPWDNFQSFGIHHIRQKYIQNPKHTNISLAISEAIIKDYVGKMINEDILRNEMVLSPLVRDTLKSFELAQV